ncbi:MAG: hypothetical protein ABEJ76_01175 [Halanaeroarchaeum sp.]
MTRGLSTVVDVAFAILLVGSSVAVLSGVHPADPAPRVQPGTGGEAVAGSTMTVRYERADGASAAVTGTVAGLVRDAAIARHRGVGGRYVAAVTDAVDDRLAETGVRAQIVGACPGDDPVVAGQTPAGSRGIRATAYRWNATEGVDDCRPTVVVRRWSP